VEQTEDQRLRKICKHIRDDIGEGATLSAALKNHPAVFSEFLVSMVSIGESRGELDYSLLQVVDFLEKSREIKNKIVAAMIYPVVLIFAGISIMISMVTFVLPKFMTIFISYDVKLPLPTQILIQVSNFITNYYGVMLLTIVSLVVSVWTINKTTLGRLVFDLIRLRMPITGALTHNVALSRFVRTLGILHRGGVPLLKTLEFSRDAMANKYMGRAVDKVILSVRDGKGIAAPLGESKLFPPLLVQMLGIGEESGALDVLALEVADFYDQETEYKIKRQMALMEPIALVIIAGIVVFIAASFLLPMFRMATSLRQH